MYLFIKSRTAIAGAIIVVLLFLQFKEFELYWGAVFLRLEEEYWRSPFLKINFIGLIFESGNEAHEKIWKVFGAE